MSINAHIFREYDVRGIVARDLAGTVPLLLGRAFGSELRARGGTGRQRVVIGRDNRPSSPGLASLLIEGVLASDVDVIDIGTVPTPVLYWAAATLESDGAVQITGSHNPPEYNGFKLSIGGRSLWGDAIQQLRRRIEVGDFAEGSGRLTTDAVLDRYIEEIGGRFHLERPIRVVVDCGNGTGSLVAVDLLRRMGADVVPLYCDSDGTFPNHHPDPTVDANLHDLIQSVRDHGADLGVAFDGDADRIGAVDETGGIIRGDILLLLFGLDVLERRGPPQTLVYDVKCSQAVAEVYAARGGQPLMWKTGHSLIKEKMKEVGALVAGELSGHICFGEDYFGFDDALYGACALLQLLARSRTSLSARVAEFPQYVSTPEIRVEVDEESKFEIVQKAAAHFRSTHEVIEVDGARILFEGGWGLLRTSNTQPVIVLRFEADSEARLAAIRDTVESWLDEAGVAVDS
jgi:phosphomannomutase / phosphoglucomutase